MIEEVECQGDAHCWIGERPKVGDPCLCGGARYVPRDPSIRDVLARLDQLEQKIDYLTTTVDVGVCGYNGDRY